MALWGAIQRRYQAQATPTASSGPTVGARSGPKPPMTRTQGPDGRIQTTYNMWSYAKAQGGGSKPLR